MVRASTQALRANPTWLIGWFEQPKSLTPLDGFSKGLHHNGWQLQRKQHRAMARKHMVRAGQRCEWR
jgi:hypothetical protein